MRRVRCGSLDVYVTLVRVLFLLGGKVRNALNVISLIVIFVLDRNSKDGMTAMVMEIGYKLTPHLRHPVTGTQVHPVLSEKRSLPQASSLEVC